MVKIAFLLEEINVRGTTVALYDYATCNEEILGNQSIIVVEKASLHTSDPIAIVRIMSRFKLSIYSDLENLEKILEEEKCHILYCIKFGKNDGKLSKKIKTVIHCVFDMSEPHGDVYAGISNSVARKYGQKLFVPHMISLKPSKNGENLRTQLGISETSIVFGRYGGMDTFNLNFCWNAINKIVKERNDIYFLFINTPQLVLHPQIIYLPKIVTEEDKNKFICTCDAHLECGTLGHSFGLAIGEFSVNNKPVIAFAGPNLWNTEHLEILKDKGIYFRNYEEFYNILNNWKKEDYIEKDWNCYRDFTPEKVMEIFNNVFIL